MLQADNPNPSAAFADDESVIDRMVAQLEQATQGLPADFKLQPVQFEKVSALHPHRVDSCSVCSTCCGKSLRGLRAALGVRKHYTSLFW
jgi:hypothetical protein